jgi:hypothetical protein
MHNNKLIKRSRKEVERERERSCNMKCPTVFIVFVSGFLFNHVVHENENEKKRYLR